MVGNSRELALWCASTLPKKNCQRRLASGGSARFRHLRSDCPINVRFLPESLVIHLSRPSCVFPSFSRPPCANSSTLPDVVQPTYNAHSCWLSCVLPAQPAASLCARQRRPAPPAPHCRRDCLGCTHVRCTNRHRKMQVRIHKSTA